MTISLAAAEESRKVGLGMKRLFLGLLLSVGMLVIGTTNAFAGYCSLDPTLPVGVPVRTNIDLKVGLLGISVHVYASTTHKSTTFGGVLGLP
jgi:hypothetical protein